MNRRGVALLVALIVILLAGAVLAGALAWSQAELRAGRAWSDAAGASAAARSGLATAMVDSMARAGPTLVISPAESSRVVFARLSDSLGLLSVEGWSGAARSAQALLVRFRPERLADSAPGEGMVRITPYRDRAWISLVP